jgi:hypothetical protein
MGDLVRVLEHRPTALVIIDGVFERVPAVWHKEILFALSRGVRVFGSSSMGALRAAELHTFGMEGVGRIFEAYRDGLLEDDDEVAVAHASAEDDYRQLSDPMINIRDGLRQAREAGVISKATEQSLNASAKATFYPDRSWSSLLASSTTGVPVDELLRLTHFMPRPPNVKRSDAEALLRHVKASVEDEKQSSEPTFQFESSIFWQMMVALEGAAQSWDGLDAITHSELERHGRLNRCISRESLQRALLSFLLISESSRCSIRVPVPEANQLLSELREGTPVSAERLNWLFDVLVDHFPNAIGRAIAPFLAAEVVRSDDGNVLDAARRKQALLRKLTAGPVRMVDANVDLEALSVWYEQRFGEIGAVGGEVHARDLGFANWEEFLAEVISEYLLDRFPVVSKQ